MAYTQVGALIDFTAGTTIVSADVDSNFAAIRTVVNALVTGTDTIQAARINAVSGAGIGFGAGGLDNVQVRVSGSFTSGGADAVAYALLVSSNLTAAAGDTTAHALVAVGGAVGATIATQGNTEVVNLVATAYLSEPAITVGAGDTVTNAATLYIANAPTEGASNYALWVDAGAVQFDSTLNVAGTTTLVAVNTTGAVAIGDTGDANVTLGLVVNQGANDDDAITLKSSDIAHAVSSSFGSVETDTYLAIRKLSATLGGVQVRCFAEDGATDTTALVYALGGTAATGKNAAANGLISLYATEHDNAGSLAAVTADGNVLAVQANRGSGRETVFLVDEDGDFLYDGADGGAYDAEDDVALVRAFALVTAPNDVIRTEFDDFVKYNEDDLVRLGILGDRLDNRGLVNGAQLQRLLVGAVWQQAQQIELLRSEVKALRP